MLRSLSIILVILTISSCASMPEEGPMCVPTRTFILEPITAEEQELIRDTLPNGEVILGKIGANDIKLKNHIVFLEEIIRAHDKPLGTCNGTED